MRFLLDENVHKGLFLFLKNSGYDAIFSPKGIDDVEVFKIAVKEKRTLLSRDSDFLDDKFITSKHNGILLVRISARDIKSQITALSKLFSKYSSFDNKVVKLLSKDKFEFL